MSFLFVRIVLMLTLGLILLTPSALGAQCNSTANEATLYSTQISHATNIVGHVYDLIVTTSAFYITMGSGERMKILSNYTFGWAILYGTSGFSMTLSPDSASLLTGTTFASVNYLG